MKEIEIFKAGTRTAMSGETLSFSESDVAATASSYNPSLHEAPLVCGHPTHNAPAWGWVGKVVARGKSLFATPQQVDANFAEAVRQGRYKKISASFYTPNSPNNPVPGSYYLRHVGFLGAMPPAVKGLRAIAFAEEEAETVTIEFSEEMPDEREVELARREAELAAREARLKRAEFAQFLEGIVADGRPLPAASDELVEFMNGLNAEDEVSFSEEGDKQTPLAFFKEMLGRLPKQVEFGEVAKGAVPTAPTAEALAEKAAAYVAEQAKQGKKISLADAMAAIKKGTSKK